jgi:tetrahydromethanopterin S-methyltransferase subunit D
MKLLSCLVPVLLSNLTTNGQAQLHFKKLTGVVLNGNGAPVANAQATMVNAGTSCLTDRAGLFTLVYPLSNDTLVILCNNHSLYRRFIPSAAMHVGISVKTRGCTRGKKE